MAVVGYSTPCLDLWLVKINFVRKAGHYQLDSKGLGQFHLDSSKPVNTLTPRPPLALLLFSIAPASGLKHPSKEIREMV